MKHTIDSMNPELEGIKGHKRSRGNKIRDLMPDVQHKNPTYQTGKVSQCVTCDSAMHWKKIAHISKCKVTNVYLKIGTRMLLGYTC